MALPARLAEQAATALRELAGVRAEEVLRLVFLLHAEDRGLLPRGEHGVSEIFNSLQGEDRRAGGGSRLVAMCRRVFVGPLALEDTRRRIPDDALLRLMQALRVVDGQSVSYGDVEVEQLGVVYETLLADAARRRSGSHYTPRSLTSPIVRTALAPVLAGLGERPTRERLLAIKVCDPAMGAGAFLLEACRQLADLLVRDTPMAVSAARLLVCRHCLYGVDKDPVAVDLARLSLWLLVGDRGAPLTFLDDNFRCGDSLDSFVWDREFSRVFGRENPGFDTIVGNPPFMGGVRISGATSPAYLKRITEAFPGAGGQADLVAYFFRQSFNKLREGGTLGLLATNTISQGATRKASLQAIVRAGGTIYAAERRVAWEGPAAVMASAVWIIKSGAYAGACVLDGAPQARISAFLVPHGGSDDPRRLAANRGLAFKGVEPYGDGFVFEEGNPNANSLAVLAKLLKNEHNRGRIFCYLGGEEFNKSPTQAATRYIIDFDEMTLAEAGRWPQLLTIVRRRVRPERASKAADVAAWPWWLYWRTRPELRRVMRGMHRVLALADTSKHLSLAFVPTGRVLLNKTLVVLALDSYAAFAVLQSRVHEVWARFFGSSMKADLRYTAKDCFETFPFPAGWRTDAALGRAGSAYYAARAEWMVEHGCGLTATYNRFHDPGAAEVRGLRELHAEVDRAVLLAYGWRDLAARAVGEFSAESPVRLRWSLGVQDEVLARLLELNRLG